MRIYFCIVILIFSVVRAQAQSASKCSSVFIPSYDVVVVGAGPAGITMAESLRMSDPQSRVLVVEKSGDVGGTFRDHGYFYRMLTSFEDTAANYPSELKAILKKRLSNSGADLRLKTAVTSFEDHWSGREPQEWRYQVQAGDSLLKTKAIVYATGQVHDPLLGFSGASKAFIEKERARHDSTILTFDEVINRYEHRPTRSVELSRRSIAVFGSGVAAMNLVQYLKAQKDSVVHWFVNSESALSSRVAGFDGRYSEILKSNSSVTIEVHDEALQSISRGRSGYDLRLKTGRVVQAAHVWLATGAQSPQTDTWVEPSRGSQLLPVFDETGDQVAGRLRLSSRPPQSVYIVGIANGATAMADALPRVRALANMLVSPEPEFSELSEALQDRIIEETVQMASPSENPEFVLLAGLAGAGKSTWVNSETRNHVIIDPDRIRELIPGFLKSFEINPQTAAAKWHKAAIALQFPMVDRSLDESRSMIIDGTLRDTAFFKSLIERIRVRYPKYKIKLVYAPVSIAEAKRRVEERSFREGRFLPKLDFKKIDADIRLSVQTLSPLVDEFLVLQP